MTAQLENEQAAGDGRAARVADTPPAGGVGLALRAIGTVAAPATVVTGLLYYFGWVRTDAQARFFGIDPSVLEFSTQDYLLRSISPTFWPLAFILVAVLLGACAHALACSWFQTRARHGRLRRAAFVLGAVGVALIAFGLLATNWRAAVGHRLLVTPVAFALGVPLTGYALYVLARLRRDGDRRPRSSWPYLPAVAVTIATSLFVLSLFWAMGDYAHLKGRELARNLSNNLTRLANVVVYSERDLAIDAPGVTRSDLGGAEGAYRYRYSGLRLLIRSQDKYFLVPEKYDGTAIVLPESEAVRFEFVRR